MTNENKLDLLKSVANDLNLGYYKNLFKYLEYKKKQELLSAQMFARTGENQEAVSSILATSIYDSILSWGNKGGELLEEIISINNDITMSTEEN